MHGAPRLATGHLDARLLADADIAFAGAVIGTVRNRNRKSREGCNRSGFPDSNLLALQPADASDQGQMVIVSAFLIAFLLPPAYLAVRCRFGICFRLCRRPH